MVGLAEVLPTSIVVVGPLPPPVHGAGRITQAVLDQVRPVARERGVEVAVVSTAPAPDRGGVGYHLDRVGVHLRAVGAVAAARSRGRGGTVVYVGGAGGAGLWYQLAVVAAARALGSRVVFHHHAYSYLSGAPSRAMRAIAGLTGRSGAHVCLSPGMAEAFRSRYRSRSAVLIVSNASFVSADTGAGERRRTDGAFRLVHVSNLSVEKGTLRVLHAFEALRERGADVTLTLVGDAADPRVLSALERARVRHPARLHHLGTLPRSGVDAALDRADLFVLPTTYRHEAQPLVLLEALSRGIPVLATARGAIADLLPDGWLIDGDAASVERRIAELMGSDWAGLSRTAREAFAASRRCSDDLVAHLVGPSLAPVTSPGPALRRGSSPRPGRCRAG